MDGWGRAALGAVRAWWTGKPAPDNEATTNSTAAVRQVEARPVTPEGPAAPPATPLAARSLQEVDAAASRVPSPVEVAMVLQDAGFDSPLQLGMALDLPPGLILASAPWTQPDWPLQQVLGAALPLDMGQLARLLEGQPFTAPNIARQVRQLARRENMANLTRQHGEQQAALARLLAPVARPRDLGTALGLSEEEIRAIEENFSASPRTRAATTHRLVDAACETSPPTCGDWLSLLARTGLDSVQLRQIADPWQLRLPAAYDNWEDYLVALKFPDQDLRAFVGRHQQDPAAVVPLSQLWPLIASPTTGSPGFAMALDNSHTALQPGAHADDTSNQVVLLHYAAQREPGGGLTWSCLEHMGRLGCLSRDLIRLSPFPPVRQPPETVSRPLKPSDLLPLTRGPAAERQALEMAGLLGVGVCYGQLQGGSGYANAMEIWRQIYNKIPGLETGHLVQLFREFDRPDLVTQLTRHADSQLQPERPLEAVSPHAARFVAMARQFYRLGAASATAFAARTRENAYDSWTQVPAGMDPVCRWLNHFAQHEGRVAQRCRQMDPDRDPPPNPEGSWELTP